ncbi:hypothetical protein [Streptomyces sp. NPDC053542]|uniref:hypothetical protein n=1 Tax=Streptomyces sp. NPDC053542 TaxID=3365710 RepID=UPI0037D61576
MVPGLRSLIVAGLLTATTLLPTTAVPAAAVAHSPVRTHTRAADPPQPQAGDGLPPDGLLSGRGSGRPQPSVQDQPGTGATGRRPQDPGTSMSAGASEGPAEPDDSASPSSTASGPSPSADASDSATASPGRPTPSHSASASGSGSSSGGATSRPATPPRTGAATPSRTGRTSGPETPHASGTSESAATALEDPGATGRPTAGEHSDRPYAPLSPHGRTHAWQTLRPPHRPAAAGPSSTSRETTSAVRSPYAPTEHAARVARVLPFGAGLALTGLGLAFIGLRLRRR